VGVAVAVGDAEAEADADTVALAGDGEAVVAVAVEETVLAAVGVADGVLLSSPQAEKASREASASPAMLRRITGPLSPATRSVSLKRSLYFPFEIAA
jgi:hypothetical protein